MARILEVGASNPSNLLQTIRCCEGTYANKSNLAVRGCFSLVEITPPDIDLWVDGDGDFHYTFVCPNCRLTLHPSWQIGPGFLLAVNRHHKR